MDEQQQQKRALVRAQSGVDDDARIEAALAAAGGDEVLATLELLGAEQRPNHRKKPSNVSQKVWETVRQICDDKDKAFQQHVDAARAGGGD